MDSLEARVETIMNMAQASTDPEELRGLARILEGRAKQLDRTRLQAGQQEPDGWGVFDRDSGKVYRSDADGFKPLMIFKSKTLAEAFAAKHQNAVVSPVGLTFLLKPLHLRVTHE